MTWLDDRIDEWHKTEQPKRREGRDHGTDLHRFLGMSWDLYKKFVEEPPRWVLGIDEVGCGCWAGPMVVGACLAPIEWTHELLRDSKDVKTEKGRARILEKLESSPGARYFLRRTSVEGVDRGGVRKARMEAFMAICAQLSKLEPRTLVVIDGDLAAPGYDCVLLPKADTFVPQVMAAAMTAKVARDTEMRELAKQYPQYGFEKHKGYGGGDDHQHTIALKKHGPCPLHRKSFRPIQKYHASSTSTPTGG